MGTSGTVFGKRTEKEVAELNSNNKVKQVVESLSVLTKWRQVEEGLGRGKEK